MVEFVVDGAADTDRPASGPVGHGGGVRVKGTDTLDEVAHRLSRADRRYAVVLHHRSGRPIGFITYERLVHERARHPAGVAVAEVMLPLVAYVPENASVSTAFGLMAYEGVTELVVLSKTGGILGILTGSGAGLVR